MLGFDLLFPSNLTQQQKLLLKGALFLPPKLDAVQVGRPQAWGPGVKLRGTVRSYRAIADCGACLRAGVRRRSAPPTNLRQPMPLLLPQAKALRAFDSAFRDSQHGWSTGVLPGEEGGS